MFFSSRPALLSLLCLGRGRSPAAAVLGVMACVAVGCGPQSSRPTIQPAVRDSITPITPRCAGVQSCLLGRVIAAETSAPLSRAAVFLERISQEKDKDIRITTVTDDQGVFEVGNAPPGHYRLAVYKDARRHEITGVKLGESGTTMIPVRLAPR